MVVIKNEADREYWKIFKSGAEKAFDDFKIDGKVVAPVSKSQITEQEIKLLKVVL
ncbi:hypothetical protein [Bacillus sp. MUM 116]|uniref:hypothetical protein n=1 Tax=Bacillus sp. MUM 116 TaxID=1678002 RepID=UPI0015A5065C|nr:hypothetical protein [Bacillus sp. MUM 116]